MPLRPRQISASGIAQRGSAFGVDRARSHWPITASLVHSLKSRCSSGISILEYGMLRRDSEGLLLDHSSNHVSMG